MRTLRNVVAVAVVASMLSGCAGQNPALSAPHASTSDAEPTPVVSLGGLTRDVLAVFESDVAGAYTVSVEARYDIPLYGGVAAIAHGELEVDDTEIYFLAAAKEDPKNASNTVTLVIDDSLAMASLRATVEVVSCTDKAGGKITDGRCPIGQRVAVEVNWNSSQQIEQAGPANPLGTHPGKGRKATAEGKIGSSNYAASTYAIIMEHLTYQ